MVSRAGGERGGFFFVSLFLLRRRGKKRESEDKRDGKEGLKRGSLRHTARSRTLAEATGTNGLNFIFCNTSVPLRHAVPCRFHGTHAPAIYFVLIFLGLTFFCPFERNTHITFNRALLFFFSPSSSSRDPCCSSTWNRVLPSVPFSLLPISARFIDVIITQQSGLFRAYSSAGR